MKKENSYKVIFWSVILYLSFSILFIFWLPLANIIYSEGTWQYERFYGQGGSLALMWLLIALLPAYIFLLVKSRGKQLISRLLGSMGFYCLLAGLISEQGYLAYPGFVFLFMSIIFNRYIKRKSANLKKLQKAL